MLRKFIRSGRVGSGHRNLTRVQLCAEHVDDVIKACARSMYAISVLRSRGMCASLLQQVFQSVVISELTYAAPAWWGFSMSADRLRFETFLRQAARSGL